MIKTEADLAKLTARQREVLVAIARQLSKEKVYQFSQIAEATANIDAEKLIQVYVTVQAVLSRDSSTAPSISPALASLVEEWQATLNKQTNEKEPGEPHNHDG